MLPSIRYAAPSTTSPLLITITQHSCAAGFALIAFAHPYHVKRTDTPALPARSAIPETTRVVRTFAGTDCQRRQGKRNSRCSFCGSLYCFGVFPKRVRCVFHHLNEYCGTIFADLGGTGNQATMIYLFKHKQLGLSPPYYRVQGILPFRLQ